MISVKTSDIEWEETKPAEGGGWRDLIMEAIGQASMCWSEVPTGVFQSDRAVEIGERLLARIEAVEKATEERTRREVLKEIEDGMIVHDTCIRPECCSDKTWTLLSRLNGNEGETKI